MTRICIAILLIISFSKDARPQFLQGFNPFQSCQQPSQYAATIMRRILNITQQNQIAIPQFNFCKNPYVPNAYAQSAPISNGFQVITTFRIDYNPNWFGQFDVAVDNDWAMIGVLAHELGHIQHFGQLSSPYIQSPQQAIQNMYQASIPRQKELRADEFAGFVLAKMGANINDVASVLKPIYTLHGSMTHPNSGTRLQSLFKGYVNGGGASSNQVSQFMQAHQNLQNKFTRW